MFSICNIDWITGYFERASLTRNIKFTKRLNDQKLWFYDFNKSVFIASTIDQHEALKVTNTAAPF